MEHSERRLVASVLVDGRIGGPQRRVVQVGTVLKEMGWDTLLIFPPMGRELPDYAATHGFPCATLALSRLRRQGKIWGILRYLLRFPIEVWGLMRLFRRHRVDLVHANSLFAFQAVVAARLSGRPVLWHFNDMALPRSLCTFVTKCFGPLATIRAYSSRNVLRFHRDRDGAKIAFLHPPVDLDRFKPASAEREDAGALRLIAVGNVNPLKGYHDLITALAELGGLDMPWRLDIAGAKLETAQDYLAELEAAIARHGLRERITFLGAVDDVAALLPGHDIFVMCSRSESGPMVLLEAMACGLPPVASDVGFVREVVTDGESGLIVPPGDSRALAAAIRRMIEDVSFRRGAAAKARDAIGHDYTVRGAAAAHDAAYRRMIGRY
jgi:glycosyltransferase involved in cell wall biosynthesis